MIVDASAVLAIILAEDDADRFSEAVSNALHLRISAVNWLEAAIRLDRISRPKEAFALDDFIDRAEIEIAAVTPAHALLARRAYRAYGKGSEHPARLNLGDCFAYGLAKATGEPLLCKGDEFRSTDIETV